ncbi:MAG: hypothetical protein KY453_13055, partial [Gemmatimonadetes bacterium]|nr:hypothetical protein [Gemmatimonadota bacterium]
LVTGPANAEKARAVLGGVREARARDPLLVVPTAADVERFRAELADGGVVLGARVVTFRGLLEEVAARTGAGSSVLGPVARERVARSVVAATPLAALASSASTPGFALALCALCAELEAARVTPQRFTRALADWNAATGRDGAYGRELAALYAGWRHALERLGSTDRELRDAAALDALVATPAAWGDAPVFVYGFDDLARHQCDTLVALGRVTEVCASLPYEPGRVAFAGRATTFATLAPEAAAVTRLEARAEHYAPAARTALHHLERGLFESPMPPAAPGDAVALLEGGGERAELELVAAEVRARLDDGVSADEIAVVCRAPGRVAPLLARVFGALGIAVACERRVSLERTALGRGLLGLLRAALADGRAEDLLAWLRTPGRLAAPWATDRLERRVRREHLRSATEAREVWEADGGAILWELDRLREVASHAHSLLAEVAARATALLAADRRGEAPQLTTPELADARALGTVRRALDELGELARIDRSLGPGAADVIAALEGLEVSVDPHRRGDAGREVEVGTLELDELHEQLIEVDDGLFLGLDQPHDRLRLLLGTGRQIGLSRTHLAGEVLATCGHREVGDRGDDRLPGRQCESHGQAGLGLDLVLGHLVVRVGDRDDERERLHTLTSAAICGCGS